MKRRGGQSPSEKPPEACGVWLDASAFKRRKVMDLVGKQALRILKQYSRSSAGNIPLPRTKQTTILTFFAAATAGERKTITSERVLATLSNGPANLKVSDLPGGERSRVPAFTPQVQDGRPASVKEAKGLCPPFAAAQGPRGTFQPIERETVPEGRDSLTLDFIQHQEEKGSLHQLPVAGSPLKENNGAWQRLATLSGSSQNLGKRYRYPSTFVGMCDAENIDPEPEEGLNKTASGFCISFSNPIGNVDEGSENGSPDLMRPLFPEDSERHQITPRCFCDGEGRLLLRKEACRDKPGAIRSSFCKGHLGDCYSAERSRSATLGRPGFSLLTEDDVGEKSCYDLLFTEDSEGNIVIKH